jgi:glycosyltransferase involved in cell wall biosynthesis
MKLAYCYHVRGHDVFLDLGYDIKPDKRTFLQSYGDEVAVLPPWIRLARTANLQSLGSGGYNRDFIQKTSRQGFGSGPPDGTNGFLSVPAMIAEITNRIVATWQSLGVTMVVVENGTLPENVIFTWALYQAISLYGRTRQLGKYVLWRDHDTMWFCEPEKYGGLPSAPHIPRPTASPYIYYASLTSLAARTISEWAGGTPIEIIPNCFKFSSAVRRATGFREAYSIPKDAFVIARCTRVIPQKRIDREITLLKRLGEIAASRGSKRRFHLVITGPTDEDPEEFNFLKRLASSLKVEEQVHFINGALSHHKNGSAGKRHYSIPDLLEEADLSSFLTSYRYEGFGNPPGEACAQGVPFISSTYELYNEVYGSKGLRALLFPITEDGEGTPSQAWAAELFERISDEQRMTADAAFNFERARSYFSLEVLERKLMTLFPNYSLAKLLDGQRPTSLK